jgi:hypothetical protein
LIAFFKREMERERAEERVGGKERDGEKKGGGARASEKE